MKKSKFVVACLLVGLPVFSGCVLVPVIDSVNKVGFTEGQRIAKLNKDVKAFNEALYWGNLSSAMSYVDPKDRDRLKSPLRESLSDVKTVDSKVENVDFTDGAHRADVEVKWRRFNQSNLLVKDLRETQTWAFSIADGWRVVDIKSDVANKVG